MSNREERMSVGEHCGTVRIPLRPEFAIRTIRHAARPDAASLTCRARRTARIPLVTPTEIWNTAPGTPSATAASYGSLYVDPQKMYRGTPNLRTVYKHRSIHQMPRALRKMRA